MAAFKRIPPIQATVCLLPHYLLVQRLRLVSTTLTDESTLPWFIFTSLVLGKPFNSRSLTKLHTRDREVIMYNTVRARRMAKLLSTYLYRPKKCFSYHVLFVPCACSLCILSRLHVAKLWHRCPTQRHTYRTSQSSHNITFQFIVSSFLSAYIT